MPFYKALTSVLLVLEHIFRGCKLMKAGLLACLSLQVHTDSNTLPKQICSENFVLVLTKKYTDQFLDNGYTKTVSAKFCSSRKYKFRFQQTLSHSTLETLFEGCPLVCDFPSHCMHHVMLLCLVSTLTTHSSFFVLSVKRAFLCIVQSSNAKLMSSVVPVP